MPCVKERLRTTVLKKPTSSLQNIPNEDGDNSVTLPGSSSSSDQGECDDILIPLSTKKQLKSEQGKHLHFPFFFFPPFGKEKDNTLSKPSEIGQYLINGSDFSNV